MTRCTCNFTADEMDAACSPWHRAGCPAGKPLPDQSANRYEAVGDALEGRVVLYGRGLPSLFARCSNLRDAEKIAAALNAASDDLGPGGQEAIDGASRTGPPANPSTAGTVGRQGAGALPQDPRAASREEQAPDV